MMKLLPVETVLYKTSLSKQEILQRLSNVVRQKNPLLPASTHVVIKSYKGIIKETTFSIVRIIQHRNSFLPKITGTVSAESNGTIVNIRMNLQPLVSIILIIHSVFMVIGSFMFSRKIDSDTLIIATSLLVMYTVMLILFRKECNRSKKDLQKLFDASVEENG